KQAEREAKAAEAALRRAQAQAAKLERARQARNKVLESATNDVITHLSIQMELAAALVSTIYMDLQTRYGLSQNEAANAVRLAASKVKGGSAADLTRWADDVAQAALSEPWSLYALPSLPG